MPALISIDQLKEHVTTSLTDDAVQRIIDANDEAILDRCGPLGEITTIRFPRDERHILLGVRPTSITSITEVRDTISTVLAADDYVLVRRTLRREWNGTNPDTVWAPRVDIVWTPVDSTARRIVALIEMCAIDIKGLDSGAVVSRTVGSHSVTYRNPVERINAKAEALASLPVPEVPEFA